MHSLPNHPFPKNLLRPFGEAISDFDMIREGDRILIGLSGGKDSLSLLHLLKRLQQRAPVRFELAAITIDPQTADFDPSPLIPYLKAQKIDYHYQPYAIETLAQKHLGKKSYCAFCSRLKRGKIYQIAREQGYNVIALGQHLDDLAESFLMSAFFNGQLQTMKAHYRNDDGDLRIIRPLVYCREQQLADFAQMAKLPVIAENCPACFSKPQQRQRMKQLLAKQAAQHPTLFKHLRHTLQPLMNPSETS
ncbi:MAG: ATP-binding protein [Gammaproteobacteria bacterium]|nr:ATP-binding protein [Gammaproteobacteria bacterium]